MKRNLNSALPVFVLCVGWSVGCSNWERSAVGFCHLALTTFWNYQNTICIGRLFWPILSTIGLSDFHTIVLTLIVRIVLHPLALEAAAYSLQVDQSWAYITCQAVEAKLACMHALVLDLIMQTSRHQEWTQRRLAASHGSVHCGINQLGHRDRPTLRSVRVKHRRNPLQILVPPENCDAAERNFRVFAQPRNFCHGAQLSRNFGSFQAVWAIIIFHFGEIWRQIGPLSTRNLSFPKFIAVLPKIATSCLHTYFRSRCHWARVTRLMTLQRSLQYSLSLSCTKTLFPKIFNFFTSLGLYNIDRLCFVVCCQNLKKYQRIKVTFYIQKWAKLHTTSAQLFVIFCATSATSLAQLLDFLCTTFWGGTKILQTERDCNFVLAISLLLILLSLPYLYWRRSPSDCYYWRHNLECLCRFFIESISYLQDRATVELFYHQATTLVFKVSDW